MTQKRVLNIKDLDFAKVGGLLPVVVQDYESKKVLTLAYVNRKALELTLETGFAHYFRRSFQKVMKKGESSGNTQEIKEIRADCDADALLLIVKQKGPACHKGEETCFHNNLKREDYQLKNFRT